jgi:glycosyltransferase involved in cell wall biosynthesis
MHGTLSEAPLGLKLKKDYKKPLLVTLYGEDINRYAKQVPSNYLSKLILKSVDGIICQSKFLENETRSMGINNKFFIIPMGALTSKFKPKSQKKARKLLNLPENKRIVLFVGHLAVRKGVDYLIRAFSMVLKKEKDALCCIVGKGYSERDLKSLTSSLKLDGYVKFLGSKSNEEVALYMNACDLFVLPSLSEGLPVVLCEALACGKPVVATNVSGTPELLNEDVGCLVEPKDIQDLADKIIMALNKKWDRHDLLKRGKEFSVSNSAKKLMKVYKSFLKKVR